MFVYELSGCGFESSCSYLNFRFRACFEQGFPWHPGNYGVRIHSETRTWHDKNMQSWIFSYWYVCFNFSQHFLNFCFKLFLGSLFSFVLNRPKYFSWYFVLSIITTSLSLSYFVMTIMLFLERSLINLLYFTITYFDILYGFYYKFHKFVLMLFLFYSWCFQGGVLCF